MSFFIDIIGSFIIGGMLLMMMITFQYQMQESADRAMYMKEMVDHMDQAAVKLNSVIALAGIGYPVTESVIHATADSLVFRTYWNYQTDQLALIPVTLSIKLSPVPSPYGYAAVIRQDGVPLNDFGYLFWIDGLTLRYFDRNDIATTTAANVRSAEVRLFFFRTAPRHGSKVIRNRLQVKCFFMNAYMRGA
ncbi:MAG: hypothetical protein Q8M98_00305 [Candidatus Cloacimonadaceae bacterium]|nr:hypothetical protein [Candidatus Cloacimonadaceae bacterium]MDP3113192.1 hypothetical protein [Candidatus Cloacimonadaceae bacterium]